MSDLRYEGYLTDGGVYACAWEGGQRRPLWQMHKLQATGPSDEMFGYFPPAERSLAIALIFDLTGSDQAAIDHARQLAEWLQKEVIQAHWTVSADRLLGWLMERGYPAQMLADGVDLVEMEHAEETGSTNANGHNRRKP